MAPTSATEVAAGSVTDVEARTERLLAEHLGAPQEEFWAAQFDLGLAWIHFPEGKGGLGLDPGFQDLVDERLIAANAPQNLLRNMMGVGMAGPTLIAFGTEEQQRRLLRPTFTCEEIWCQMFSEPGAGSDVASLSTSAVRDGDEWVVNGQKVWTSMAHVARWGLLLVRTDPDVPKHRGLSYFYIDMHQPGVEVRPLRQMTGEAEFNEIFFTDARVPDTPAHRRCRRRVERRDRHVDERARHARPRRQAQWSRRRCRPARVARLEPSTRIRARSRTARRLARLWIERRSCGSR